MELIDFIAAGTTPETLIGFHPSQSAQRRVAELMERREDGRISVQEAAELEEFVQIEHLLIMAKARARRRLQVGAGN